MGIQANRTYNGTVGDNNQLVETPSGTMGYQISLCCEDGDTSCVMWMTDKTKKMVSKTLEILGVDEEKLTDPAYLDFGMSLEIQGRELSFTTVEEEYNGQTSIKVSWINKRLSEDLKRDAAKYFRRP
jgi:cysteine synthase